MKKNHLLKSRATKMRKPQKKQVASFNATKFNKTDQMKYRYIKAIQKMDKNQKHRKKQPQQ